MNAAQLDLFAQPAPPPVAVAPSAPGQPAVWNWGLAAKNPGSLTWGGPGFRIMIHQDGGRMMARTDYSMHNSGGSGPFREVEGETQDEALLGIVRKSLRTCARNTHGGWRHEETGRKQYAALAEWLISLCPPLMFGADLVDEYAVMCAEEKENEDRRCAMLRAKDRIEKALHAAALEGGFYAYPELIQDRESDEDFRDTFKGEWCITGHVPGGLEVVIYSRCDRPFNGEGDTSTVLLDRARELFAAAADVPVRFATADEYELCYSDRRRVTW